MVINKEIFIAIYCDLSTFCCFCYLLTKKKISVDRLIHIKYTLEFEFRIKFKFL